MTLSTPQQAALDEIDAADADLRTLSLEIRAQPELGYEETHAHTFLTD